MPGYDYEHRLPPAQYVQRKDTDNFSCPHQCTCKYIDDRSPYDQLQRQHFIQGVPYNLPVAENIPGWDRGM